MAAAVIRGKKVVVVMPAYNAGKTLRTTCAEVPMDIVDEIILVDDASRDETVTVAKELGEGKTVVAVLCDTGERYLTHPLFAEIDGPAV